MIVGLIRIFVSIGNVPGMILLMIPVINLRLVVMLLRMCRVDVMQMMNHTIVKKMLIDKHRMLTMNLRIIVIMIWIGALMCMIELALVMEVMPLADIIPLMVMLIVGWDVSMLCVCLI